MLGIINFRYFLSPMNIREKLKFIEQISQPKTASIQQPTNDFAIQHVIDGEIFASEFGETFIRTTEQDIN